MSSLYVRTTIKQFLDDESDETIVDLTDGYEEIQELLSENSIQPDAPWLGLEFIGGEESPISLAATNDQGSYREYGSVYFHFAAAARLGVGASIISRGDVLRNKIRGRRIGDIVIESMTTMNTGAGATLHFDAGYVSGSFQAVYYRDINL